MTVEAEARVDAAFEDVVDDEIERGELGQIVGATCDGLRAKACATRSV